MEADVLVAILWDTGADGDGGGDVRDVDVLRCNALTGENWFGILPFRSLFVGLWVSTFIDGSVAELLDDA